MRPYSRTGQLRGHEHCSNRKPPGFLIAGTLHQRVRRHGLARKANDVLVNNILQCIGKGPGLHQIQGVGDGFIPPVLDVSLIDDVELVTDDDAIETARALARKAGLLAGTSSGACVPAASQVSRKPGGERRAVTVLPDRTERYFSIALI